MFPIILLSYRDVFPCPYYFINTSNTFMLKFAQLYKAGGNETYEDYCCSYAGILLAACQCSNVKAPLKGTLKVRIKFITKLNWLTEKMHMYR